jgi:general secretion pathway protein M
MSERSSAGLTAALAPLRAWWRAQAPREQRLLMLGGTVLLLFAVWVLAVQPALATLKRVAVERDQLEIQLQTMQQLAAEVGELRSAPPVSAEQSAAALQAATERLGDSGKLMLQGERAVLTLNGVGTSQLRDWLAEARSGARARPVEATLSRAAQGYSGTVVVAFGSGL